MRPLTLVAVLCLINLPLPGDRESAQAFLRETNRSSSKLYHLASQKLIGDSSSEEEGSIVWLSISESSRKSENTAMASASAINIEAVESALNALPDETASDEKYKSLISDFLTSSSGKLVDWINNTIPFSGFDAVVMRKKILSKTTGRRIMLCILIGLIRGNNIDRINQTMKPTDMQKEFAQVARSLALKKNVAGDYSAITLSRMIACFPQTVCMILHNHEIPMAIPFTELQIVNSEYPSIARHQACAGILPHTLPEGDLNQAFDIILVPHLKVSEVINSKVKDWSKLSPHAKAETSSMDLHNSYNSKVLALGEREYLSKNYGIMTSNKELSSRWRAVAASAKVWLIKHYQYSHTA